MTRLLLHANHRILSALVATPTYAEATVEVVRERFGPCRPCEDGTCDEHGTVQVDAGAIVLDFEERWTLLRIGGREMHDLRRWPGVGVDDLKPGERLDMALALHDEAQRLRGEAPFILTNVIHVDFRQVVSRLTGCGVVPAPGRERP